jgi:hypothetical protein
MGFDVHSWSSSFFFLGKFYLEIDKSYWDLTNPLIIAHAYMSIVEVFMCWFGIWLVSNNDQDGEDDDAWITL